MAKASLPHRRLERFSARVVHVFIEEDRLRFEGQDHFDEIVRDGTDLNLVGEVPGNGNHSSGKVRDRCPRTSSLLLSRDKFSGNQLELLGNGTDLVKLDWTASP